MVDLVDQSSLSAWRKLGSLATHWAHNKNSDQTGWMPRQIWVFAGRTVILLVLSWDGSNGINRFCDNAVHMTLLLFDVIVPCHKVILTYITWTASSKFGTYRLCEQRRFRRACASAQSRQNLRCSLIQAVSQEEPSDRKPDPFWMAVHAQLKFVMTECSKTQIRLTGLISTLKATDWNLKSHIINTRGPLVLYPSPECWRYVKISGYWRKEV